MGGVNDAAAPVLVPVARFVVLLDRCLLGSGINGAGTASSENPFLCSIGVVGGEVHMVVGVRSSGVLKWVYAVVAAYAEPG